MTRSFDTTTGAWIANTTHFPEGYNLKVDAHTGQRIATGPDAYGLVRSLHLDTPLCKDCDAPLDAGVCDSCEQVFLDVAPVIDLGGGWMRAVA